MIQISRASSDVRNSFTGQFDGLFRWWQKVCGKGEAVGEGLES